MKLREITRGQIRSKSIELESRTRLASLWARPCHPQVQVQTSPSRVSQLSESASCKSATFFGVVRCSALLFAICKLVADVRLNSFFWQGQVLCSTFCHLRVSHRFEVKLAARRFGTNFHVGSPLGGLYPLSSPIFCVSLMPRQKPTDANSQ